MLNYPIADVYPQGFAYLDTSNSTAVTDDVAEVLHENPADVESTRQKASGKAIFISLGVIACLAIFLGIE